MTEKSIATNWYYISALILYTNNEEKDSQEVWAGIIPVDSDKITGSMLDKMSGFVMNKFAQEHELKKVEQFKAVTLLGLSNLGHMTQEEFQAKESLKTAK